MILADYHYHTFCVSINALLICHFNEKLKISKGF